MSFRIESNMNQVLQSLIIKLDDGFPIETEKALRLAGNDTDIFHNDYFSSP